MVLQLCSSHFKNSRHIICWLFFNLLQNTIGKSWISHSFIFQNPNIFSRITSSKHIQTFKKIIITLWAGLSLLKVKAMLQNLTFLFMSSRNFKDVQNISYKMKKQIKLKKLPGRLEQKCPCLFSFQYSTFFSAVCRK